MSFGHVLWSYLLVAPFGHVFWAWLSVVMPFGHAFWSCLLVMSFGRVFCALTLDPHLIFRKVLTAHVASLRTGLRVIRLLTARCRTSLSARDFRVPSLPDVRLDFLTLRMSHLLR